MDSFERQEIYNVIFNAIKEKASVTSKYSPNIFKNSPTQSKIFPLIIVPQPSITIVEETLKYGEQKHRVVFDIEIYATNRVGDNSEKEFIQTDKNEYVKANLDDYITTSNRVVNPTKVAKNTIASELTNILIDLMENEFKFQSSKPQVLPNIDLNVMRVGITFTAIYKNNIFYRR